jgi:hypothetical protein
MNHFSFEFDVTLVHQSHENDPEKIAYFDSLCDMKEKLSSFSTLDIIIDWYNDFWSRHSQSFEAGNIVYSYNKETCIYRVDFDVQKFVENGNENDYTNYEDYILFVAKMLIDPDDYGEEPLKIDGVVYLVKGDIIY